MKYFKEIEGLPVLDLWTPLQYMLKNGIVDWGRNNQISLNTVPSEPDNYKRGTGSLVYDWDNAVITTDENGIERHDVPMFKKPYKEKDFTELCTQFKGTEFEDVYNELKSKYDIARVRIMKMGVKYCMSWHNDSTIRIHYPIKTQPECFMVIEDEVKHLEAGKWHWTDTTHYHTAFNGSTEERIHLVVAVL